MLSLQDGKRNYYIGDRITVLGRSAQLFLMPSLFTSRVNGFFRRVHPSFVFKSGMVFNNGTPIVNGNYHIVNLGGKTTDTFYFNPIQEINGHYTWSFKVDSNRYGTVSLSSGTKDNQAPFAMPKYSISVRFPKKATRIVPPNTNSIFLFTGEEYVSVVLNVIENSYCGDLYEKAGDYFKETKQEDYLFGISLSGGDRYWSTDKIERLANDIETGVIKYGNYKNYRENGSKTKYFNTVVLDIEHLSDELSGSGIEDKAAYQDDLLVRFIDCFKRIKQTAPWCIVVTEAHSGTFNATHDFIDGMNKCEYVDYFSPQLYTWSYTGCNEYSRTKNNLYSWGKFYKSITENPQYEYRGSSMITPSLGFSNTSFEVNGLYGRSSIADDNWGSYIDIPENPLFSGVYTGLYKGAGTNIGKKPFFEVVDSILTEDEKVFPNPDNKVFHITYPNGTDLGAADFFGKMFRQGEADQPIGGSIQFSNGFLTF